MMPKSEKLLSDIIKCSTCKLLKQGTGEDDEVQKNRIFSAYRASSIVPILFAS